MGLSAQGLWQLTEPLHAVTYFDERCRRLGREIGLKGFWQGYFAARTAPLGPAAPELVTAVLTVFAPGMVARAVPAAWQTVTPQQVIDERARRAALALRALDPQLERKAARLSAPLRVMVEDAPAAARPMFAVNRPLCDRADPVEALWQLTTALREFRGDAHACVLADRGLDGCAAMALADATGRVPAGTMRQDRGWGEQECAAAVDRLRSRGLLDADGRATERGVAQRAQIEEDTDRLADRLLRPLSEPAVEVLGAELAPVVQRVLAAKVLPFPNAIGLPRPVSEG